MKKILILLGHPDADTYSGMLADQYQASAEDVGHEVSRLNIGDMQFDVNLYQGYKTIQKLEPDLVDFQERVQWADHIVIIYPDWWHTMPAKLKGLFDRAWLPGFAFNFDGATKKNKRHLSGKSARVIIVTGTHNPFKTWWLFGDYTNELQHGILGFAGIKATVTVFGPSDHVNDAKKASWVKSVTSLARRGI